MNRKPSEEKVWLKYYKDGAYEKANDIPKNKTVWDVLEEKLFEYYDIPALEYFKREISRADFRDSVYIWARTFRAMGVETDEIVPIYGPFFPDICAMTLALNMIGACPYFLKLAISEEALREETAESKIAIVFDGMWNNVKKVFQDDKFKKVIVATASDSMLQPKKEIVSFMNYINAKKDHSVIPKSKKYIWVDDAKKVANYYTGDVKVPFVPNRSAFITSSSGTTGNLVKGTIATNESTLTQMYMGANSEIQYFPKDRCLNNLPPTASTSLNVLFFLPLLYGMTVVVDPRVTPKDYYNQIVKLKPNIALTTGSMWETLFNKVEKEMSEGKKFDFSYAKGWTIGGEGTDVKKVEKWNELMKKANAKNTMFSGYGSSELFSGISIQKLNVIPKKSLQIMHVGIPYPGLTLGVFDENNKELSYNQRGELWVKSKSAMKEYYKKEELTKKTLIDGWVHTGDIAQIDNDGFLYIWGRKKDKINSDGQGDLYLFDIANKLKENPEIKDALVLPINDSNIVVAHIVWDNINYEDRSNILNTINEKMNNWLCKSNIHLAGYELQEEMLPYSKTTLKKDKNKLLQQFNDIIQVFNNEIYNVQFTFNQNKTFSIRYAKNEKNKKRTLK